MAINILEVTAADNGTEFPLRGAMSVNLNFTPDKHFRVSFVTRDAGVFAINSSLHPFRALTAVTQTSLSIGGKIGLSATLMFDTNKREFVITRNNLVSGDGGSGTSGGLVSLAIDSTVTAAAGTPALVENLGTATAVRLKFTIPTGPTGAAGTGTTTGSSLPIGGTAGQVLTKSGSADYAVTWSTPAAGTGGTVATPPEVLLTPDVNGNVEINQAVGSNFRIVPTRNIKILNPVGYNAGSRIKIIVVQGAGAPWLVNFDSLFAFPNAQPPTFATVAGGISKVVSDFTNSDAWITDVTPDKTITGGYGKVTPLARIGQVMFLKLGGPEGQGAMNLVQNGQTIYIIRDGKGAEATGTIVGISATIAGVAVAGGARPQLLLFPDTRPAFGKALLNFENAQVSEVRDLRVSGARNSDGDARGIAPNGAASLTIKNVEITDCNNGILTGNADVTGNLTIADCLLHANGVGTPNGAANQNFNSSGFVHNIYTGDNETTVNIARSTFSDSKTGHNIKSRSATTILNQVLCYRSFTGRELNYPVGGKLYATNCVFHKTADGAAQNDLCSIGEEGVKTTRVREYIFTNCRFQNDIPVGGRDANFMWNYDTGVSVSFIDCEFIGEGALANNNPRTAADGVNLSVQVTYQTVKGIRGLHTRTLTGGPIGPLASKPVGYFPIAMTPVVG